jgi:hypothetical protein
MSEVIVITVPNTEARLARLFKQPRRDDSAVPMDPLIEELTTP